MEYLTQYNPVFKAFLAGSFSGTFSTVLLQPLDLVKTRLQNPGQLVAAANVNGRIQPGMITIFANIVRQEHIIGLWRGMVPSVARCVPGVGLYFSSLHWLKAKMGKTRNQDLGALEAVALGVVARSMSGVALIPITVIKTRYESGVYKYTSLTGALKAVYKSEGLRGLSCGLGPTLARDAPFSGLYLMFYTQTKQAVPKEWMQSPSAASAIHFTCGVIAGIAASLVTNPADVLKTKMQLYPDKFPNAFTAALYVHQTYGIKGYFKGAVPRMLRRTLTAAMAWTVFEEITRSIGLK
ncbi:mitochondrial glycine transporter B-like isoform X3 [Cydia strobilella]|uniref:mitochondrial glycine transporter B-like isoform X3 n=1 Tax=Cydia strobilella TaxID=1100964 RepID=UPI0030075566